MNTHQSSRRAVTLIEVLVTVAVAVILTLIVIVGMRSVRGQTLAMKDLHNLRLSGQDMLLWSADNDEKFLNLESKDSPVYRTVYHFDPNPAPEMFWGAYYSQPQNWNQILGIATGLRHMHWQSAYGLPARPQGMEWTLDRDTEMYLRGDPNISLSLSRYRYTLTLVTRPDLWEDRAHAIANAHTDLEPFARGIRVSNVRFPSGKGMLSNYALTPEDHHVHAVYVDGSAERRTLDSMVQPTVNPANFQGAIGVPIYHTKHGHNGRDR
jgi:prepilin-type N-terminal cleavage/methylation domain-containing protein